MRGLVQTCVSLLQMGAGHSVATYTAMVLCMQRQMRTSLVLRQFKSASQAWPLRHSIFNKTPKGHLLQAFQIFIERDDKLIKANNQKHIYCGVSIIEAILRILPPFIVGASCFYHVCPWPSPAELLPEPYVSPLAVVFLPHSRHTVSSHQWWIVAVPKSAKRNGRQ